MATRPERMKAVSAVDEAAIVAAAAAALREKRPLRNARLKQAANALQSGRVEEAERLLSGYLAERPDDAGALFLRAETALKRGRKEQAKALLGRCLTAAPDYEAARFIYASTLFQLNRLDASLAEIERLLRGDPHNILHLDLKAAVLAAMGDFHSAMLCRRQLVEDHESASELWVKYGKSLRSIGKRDEAVAAFRHAIRLAPTSGTAWWTLADLKTWKFSDDEIAEMESALARAGTGERM